MQIGTVSAAVRSRQPPDLTQDFCKITPHTTLPNIRPASFADSAAFFKRAFDTAVSAETIKICCESGEAAPQM
jgi:hypothetical protein